MPDYLSTEQAAERLSVDARTVRRYVQEGRLQGVKLKRELRVTASSVTALLTPSNGQTAALPANRIIAVVNQKGGVGKSTTSFNLAVALSRRSKRVLLVDMDPQGGASASAGIPAAQLTATIYQVLLDDSIDPMTVVRESPSGVEVLPANLDLAAAEVELFNVTLRELVLKDVLAKVRSRYDFILIDCPPNLGLLTMNALGAADQVLIPMECDFLATRGLQHLLRTITHVQKRLNRDLKIAGIVATKFDGRLRHANEILQELRTNFPDQVFGVVIKNTTRLKEAPAAGLSILDYDPHSEVAAAFTQLAQEVSHAS